MISYRFDWHPFYRQQAIVPIRTVNAGAVDEARRKTEATNLFMKQIKKIRVYKKKILPLLLDFCLVRCCTLVDCDE